MTRRATHRARLRYPALLSRVRRADRHQRAADGGLWLVCSTAEQADGLLARISAAMTAHVRVLVVDPEVALAA